MTSADLPGARRDRLASQGVTGAVAAERLFVGSSEPRRLLSRHCRARCSAPSAIRYVLRGSNLMIIRALADHNCFGCIMHGRQVRRRRPRYARFMF